MIDRYKLMFQAAQLREEMGEEVAGYRGGTAVAFRDSDGACLCQALRGGAYGQRVAENPHGTAKGRDAFPPSGGCHLQRPLFHQLRVLLHVGSQGHQ